MDGKLYLCATPIGNLEDITLRVLNTLREVDLIAAEDTRNSIKLLNHYEIKTPMTSYHEYNRIEKAHALIKELHAGKNIAVITDAGSPGISDPGEDLVRICREEGICVTSLPGPCACITALSLSGLPSERFSFEAFLPREKKERAAILEEMKNDTKTIVLYEAPHHLVGTLKDLLAALGDRRIALCREMTKIHETVYDMTLSEAVAHYEEEEEPRGEFVILIEGITRQELTARKRESWENVTLSDHIAYYTQAGMSKKDAMKQAAKDRGVAKSDIYRQLLDSEDPKEPSDDGPEPV